MGWGIRGYVLSRRRQQYEEPFYAIMTPSRLAWCSGRRIGFLFYSTTSNAGLVRGLCSATKLNSSSSSQRKFDPIAGSRTFLTRILGDRLEKRL